MIEEIKQELKQDPIFLKEVKEEIEKSKDYSRDTLIDLQKHLTYDGLVKNKIILCLKEVAEEKIMEVEILKAKDEITQQYLGPSDKKEIAKRLEKHEININESEELRKIMLSKMFRNRKITDK
jgi:hypothetical protein